MYVDTNRVLDAVRSVLRKQMALAGFNLICSQVHTGAIEEALAKVDAAFERLSRDPNTKYVRVLHCEVAADMLAAALRAR